jgi:hypothetical protein
MSSLNRYQTVTGISAVKEDKVLRSVVAHPLSVRFARRTGMLAWAKRINPKRLKPA